METSGPSDIRSVPRNRQRPSPSRCLGITCLVFTAALLIWLVSLPIFLLKGQFDEASNPHTFLLHNDSRSNSIQLQAQAVRPLIDQKTEFDIVLTIWARKGEPHAFRQEFWDEPDIREERGAEYAIQVEGVFPMHELFNIPPQEEVLFSHTVLRAVSLADKGLKKEINLSIPMDRL